MNRQSFIPRAVLAIVACGLAAATCGRDPDSNVPVRPSGSPVTSIEIIGPDSMAPGQTLQYTAKVRLADGTVKTAGAEAGVRWLSSSTVALRVSPTGVATASSSMGEAVLTADYGSRRASKEVVILPEGTFRIAGRIVDDEFPDAGVAAAKVEALPQGPSTFTDGNGMYKLYGVSAGADLRITAPGYEQISQLVQMPQHATQNFRLVPSGPRLTLAGPYLLEIDVTKGCSQIPVELQHRRYDAFITQNGTKLDVRLTEPRFRIAGIRGDRFTGKVGQTGATFELPGEFYYYYGFYPAGHPAVVERLPDNSHLVVSGEVTATGSAAGLSGFLNGSIGGVLLFDSRFPTFTRYLGGCDFKSAIRFSLSPR